LLRRLRDRREQGEGSIGCYKRYSHGRGRANDIEWKRERESSRSECWSWSIRWRRSGRNINNFKHFHPFFNHNRFLFSSLRLPTPQARPPIFSRTPRTPSRAGPDVSNHRI